MFKNICYLCDRDIPAGQSFYEDHGVRVCLRCFKTTPRCPKCRFPSRELMIYPGVGTICEFCQKDQEPQQMNVMRCYLCQCVIPEEAPHFSGHGKTVCKKCFKDAHRCFLCRFPQYEEHIRGLGYICEFCYPETLHKDSDLASFLEPLEVFLSRLRHKITETPQIQWVDRNILLGMQLQGRKPDYGIEFLDEYLHYCYPVYYLKKRFYIMPRIPHQLFMAHMAGQLAAADLCNKYDLPHLLDHNGFARFARGWVHWVSYSTATILKYTDIQKQLSRWPETIFPDEFSKFLNMSEFRKPEEITIFAHRTLKQYAQKYL